MKNGYAEAIQIGLTAEEIDVALNAFQYFGEKVLENKGLVYNSPMGMWQSGGNRIALDLDDPFKPPSWTKSYFWILKRGHCGYGLHAFGQTGRNLLFRQLRVKNRRFFCIQRKETVKCLKCNFLVSKCLCEANGFSCLPGISLLGADDFHILNERIKKCKILGDKL